MVTKTKTASKLKTDRRMHADGATERRTTMERRDESEANSAVPERRQSSRRKVERRRQIDPTTCERDYGNSEIEFMKAMDDYKRRAGRQFPTWSEVLEVLHSLGYRQVEEPTELTM